MNMGHIKYQIRDLLLKYKNGTLTDEEEAHLEKWYMEWVPDQDGLSLQKLQHLENDIYTSLPHPEKSRRLWNYLSAAASIILVICIALSYYQEKRSKSQTGTTIAAQRIILPGRNIAVLTLGNGKKIMLSDQKTGVIIGSSTIRYNDGSVLTYDWNERNSKNEKLTITTPRGGTYHIRLPDGSDVWLNAASSLTYSELHNNHITVRNAKLEGEGYFEIYKDRSRPFIVQAGLLQVEVMGTHFNVNSYKDNNLVKTTLLEGSVRILGPKAGLTTELALLSPGEQAIKDSNGRLKVKALESPENEIAWKNGRFRFTNASLEEVMRQFARWYDVEVVYPDGIPEVTFSGGISKNLNAADALDMLQFMNVNFKIEGRRVIVENKL